MLRVLSRRFEHFRVVHAARNLRLAAEQTGMTQPALSKSIQSLERELKVDLFERTAKGMIPTKAGDLLFQRLAPMEREIQYAELAISEFVHGTGGRIKIGAGIAWSLRQTPYVLSTFHTEFPNIQIEEVSGVTDVLLPQLLGGLLDLVIADIQGLPPVEGHVVEPVWRAKRRLWVRAGHPLAGRAEVSWHDVGRFRWAGRTGDERWTKQLAEHFGALDLPTPDVILRMSSVIVMLTVVGRSDLIGVFSEDLGLEARLRNLVPLPIEAPGWELQAGVIYRSDITKVRPFRRLLAIIRSAEKQLAVADQTDHDRLAATDRPGGAES
jgi:DNA-binding transcriptional LysR family regulator